MYILYLFSLGIADVNSSFKQCIPSITRISSFPNFIVSPVYSLCPVLKLNVGINISLPFNNSIRSWLNNFKSIASKHSKL